MSEKLCIQWNDFQDNIKSVFGTLREDNDFTDVTLACEDGQQVESHKVILAASSPFFQKLLLRNKHPHPLIYMRGVRFEDLLAIVDFLYCGEAKVFEENLDSFLAIAEELQLEGLSGKTEEIICNFEESEKTLPETFSPKINTHTKVPKTSFKRKMSETQNSRQSQSLTIPSSFSGVIEEVEKRVKSMMEKSKNKILHAQRYVSADVCKVCGKEGLGSHIKDHIEANHLEGIIIPCNLCDKTFRSIKGFRNHKSYHHTNNANNTLI